MRLGVGVVGRILIDSRGEELTPKLSFTGSAWAEWEPNRRGGWVRSSCRIEAAERLAANMAG